MAHLLPGREHETDVGTCYIGEHRFTPDHRHGSLTLQALPDADPVHVAALTRDLGPHHWNLAETAFIDTETTGLAGGTGTYAFLIGVGAYVLGTDGRPSGFTVRQYVMRDPGEEPAMLDVLADHLTRFATVVSFNGRAFDVPLIEIRYRMNRQRCPLNDPPHLDLLFPARRVWRGRLASCALKDLETAVLGVRRQGDVPGWLIPSLYFDFLRDRDPNPLRPVFHHNLLDILSLATLAARLAGVMAQPAEIDRGDAYGAGCLYEARGETERAIAAFEQALAAPLPPVLRDRCIRRLSVLYKRGSCWPAAVALWERCLADGASTIFVGEELAKYHEHVTGDCRRALAIVERLALSQEVASPRAAAGFSTAGADLSRRRVRLLAKIQRQSVRPR